MTLPAYEIDEAVEQGFHFASKFEDPNFPIADYLDLLKICKTLNDDEIEEVGDRIIQQFRARAVITT